MAPPADRPATKTRSRSTGRSLGDGVDQGGQDGGLADAGALVGRLEPVPAAHGIGLPRLLRIGHQEAVALGQPVHAGADREILGILRAAVQHDDERARPLGQAGRDVEPVVAAAGGAGDGAAEEGGTVRHDDGGAARHGRAGAQPAQRLGEPGARCRGSGEGPACGPSPASARALRMISAVSCGW